MKGLTEKQKNMIEFIDDFMNCTGMAPTIYEIAEHFGIKTSTVFAHVRALQKKSYLTRSSKARSISLNRPKKKTRIPNGVHSIPVMDSEGREVSKRELLYDSKLFGKKVSDRDLFAMHVKDAEMTAKGILDGDIVIVKGNPEAIGKGDIVLTWLNGRNSLLSCAGFDGDMVELTGDKCDIKIKRSELPLKGVVIGVQRSI